MPFRISEIEDGTISPPETQPPKTVSHFPPPDMPQQAMPLSDVNSMANVDLTGQAIPDNPLGMSEQEIADLKAQGPIGFFEQFQRYGLGRAIPLNPFGAIAAFKTYAAVKRLQAGNYEGDTDQRTSDLQTVKEHIRMGEEERVRGVTIPGRLYEPILATPGFLAAFWLTGGLSSALSTAAGESVGGALGGIAETVTGKAITGTAEFAARALPPFTLAALTLPGTNVPEQATERQINSNLELTEKGMQLAKDAQEAPFTSLAKAIGDVYISTFVGGTGDVLVKPFSLAGKILPERLYNIAVAVADHLNLGGTYDLTRRAGFHGFLKEMGELRVAQMLKLATGVNQWQSKPGGNFMDNLLMNIPGWDDLLVDAGVLALPSAAFGIAGTLKNMATERGGETKIDLPPQPTKEELTALFPQMASKEGPVTKDVLDMVLAQAKKRPLEAPPAPPEADMAVANEIQGQLITQGQLSEATLSKIKDTQMRGAIKYMTDGIARLNKDIESVDAEITQRRAEEKPTKMLEDKMAGLLDKKAENTKKIWDFLLASKQFENETVQMKAKSVEAAALTATREKLGSFKLGVKLGKDEIMAAQKQVVGMVRSSGLPKEDQARFITDIRQATSGEKLQQAMPQIQTKIDELLGANERQDIVNRIQRLDKSGVLLEARDFIESIKQRIALKEVSPKQQMSRETTKQALTKLEEGGVVLSQDQRDLLKDVSRGTLTDLSMPELKQLDETLQSVVHQSRLKNKLLRIQKQREVDAYVDEVRSRYKERGFVENYDAAARLAQKMNPDWRDKPFEAFMTHTAEHIRPELAFQERWLGMPELFDVVRNGLRDFKRNLDKRQEDFQAIHNDINPAETIDKKVDIGRFKKTTKSFAMSVYAYSKNENAARKLEAAGFTKKDISDLVGSLSEVERRTVDTAMQYYDRVQYDRLNEVYRRLYGKNLEKEPNYFPLPRLENVVASGDVTRDLFSQAYHQGAGISTPMPKRGFTFERVGSDKIMTSLDYFKIITDNAMAVEHFIAYAEALRDVNKIKNDPAIRNMVREKLGDPFVRFMDRYVEKVAYGNKDILNAFERFSRFIRLNLTNAFLFANFPSMLNQVPALSAGAGYVGPRWVSEALVQLMAHPIETKKMIYEKSIEMKHRPNSQTRELIEIERRSSLKDTVFGRNKKLRDFGFGGYQMIDFVTSAATWLGAYNKAISGNFSEVEAIHQADSAVSRTQNMGESVFLPLIFQGSETQKLYTMFTNQLNTNYNLMLDSLKSIYDAHTADGLMAAAKATTGFGQMALFTAVIPALFYSLIGNGDDKRNGGLIWNSLDQLVGNLMWIRMVTHGMATGYWGDLTPLEGLNQDLKTVFTAKHAETKMKAALRGGGSALTGFPVGTVDRALKGELFGKKKQSGGITR